MLGMTLFTIPPSIASLAATPWFRHVATTLGLVLAAYLLWEVIRRRILRHSKFDRESALAWQDGSRNVIAILTIGTLCVLWGAEVRSLTLSVAALGATVAIVFKEVFMNLLGAAVRSVSRPFSIGDRVDINGHTGCVVAQTFMTTVLMETGPGERMTGTALSVPNALLLTGIVRNHSSTGRYRIITVTPPFDAAAPIDIQEQYVLAIAAECVAPWLADAKRHFEQLGAREFLDLPSVEPRVLLVPEKNGELGMLLQVPVPSDSRVKAEQALLRALHAPRSSLVLTG